MHYTKCILWFLFLAFASIIACTSGKQYPCPAYNNSNVKMDSTGAFTSKAVHNKDRKTGLVKKRNTKSMYDRKSHVRVY